MNKLVISLGNPIKSDDNIGNLVLDKLQKGNKNQNITFIRAEISPENFFYKAVELKPQIVYIIDAVDFGGNIGDVKLFDYNDIMGLPITTTHNIPITLFSQFIPKNRIKLIGIQPKSVGVGEELSTELSEMFEEICERIEKLLNN